MRAIVWSGLDGAIERDCPLEIADGTDALVWIVACADQDWAGVVVEVGDEVGSFDAGDLVTLPESAGDHCWSSSLWGLTEFAPGDRFGHLVRVPLAELNLLPASPTTTR